MERKIEAMVHGQLSDKTMVHGQISLKKASTQASFASCCNYISFSMKWGKEHNLCTSRKLGKVFCQALQTLIGSRAWEAEGY